MSSSRLLAQFKDAMARWASGVAVVATSGEDGIRAMTVSSLCSVSLDPLLLLVSIGHKARLLTSLAREGRFTASILGCDDASISNALARRDRPELADPTLFQTNRPPVVRGAIASLDCRVWARYPGGDHEIVVGEVESVRLGGESAPLVYWNRGYLDVG